MFEKEEISSLKNYEYEEPLGDIVISVERVKEQAIEYGHSFERELAYMVVHGFYHLMGEDHIEEEDKKQMREKEENVLNKLNYVNTILGVNLSLKKSIIINFIYSIFFLIVGIYIFNKKDINS